MKKYKTVILVLLIAGVSGVGYYFYNKASVLKANPSAVAEKEAETIVAMVGKIILLPQGELPTVATINDPSKLVGQVFFAKAKIGDKVLLYQKAAKAYLYDTVANKILEVAPIDFGEGSVAPKTTVK